MKIAMIVVRYGEKIVGGSEYHCRLIAERLAKHAEVEILTTCATDYQTWRNDLEPGVSHLNGVTVRRFPVEHERPTHFFSSLYSYLVSLHLIVRHKVDISILDDLHKSFLINKTLNEKDCPKWPYVDASKIFEYEKQWMDIQGPYSPSFRDFLKNHKDNYDLLLFFSYNYWLAHEGLQIAGDKAILIPTLHEEACLGFDLFQHSFNKAKFFLFNTSEEKKIAKIVFPNVSEENSLVAGIGFDQPCFDPDFRPESIGIKQDYIMYLGRIEESKGCGELFRYFLGFLKRYPQNKIELVLVGRKHMKIPNHPQIKYLGFQEESRKNSLIKCSKFFVCPSAYESFSLSLMEAYLIGAFVFVNGKCRVLRHHCEQSGSGFHYSDEDSFCYLLKRSLEADFFSHIFSERGKAYVRENYQWALIEEKLYKAILEVSGRCLISKK